MNEVPETRYAKTAEGVHIAYQVAGEGPVDLVVVSEWITAFDGRWKVPASAYAFDRLASFCRLALFDERGIGCSDPAPLSEVTAIEEWMADLRAGAG